MIQAVTTRFAGPTNHRGSRVLVRAQAGCMIVSWDHALGVEENHEAAAKAYLQKMGWDKFDGTWHGGALPEGHGNVFVFVPTEKRAK